MVQWLKRWHADIEAPCSNVAGDGIHTNITENAIPQHTTFHYQIPIVLILLKYCKKRRKIASHPPTCLQI